MEVLLSIVPIKQTILSYLGWHGVDGLKQGGELVCPSCCFQADFRRMGAHRSLRQDSSLCWDCFLHILTATCTIWKNVPEEREESWQMEGNRQLFQTEEERWLKSWLWEGAAAKGSEGTEQLLSSAPSLTPESSFQLGSCTHFPQSLRPQSQALCLEALVGRSSQTVMV